jgi:hypothetical protein
MSAIVGLRNVVSCAEVWDAIECLESAVPFLRCFAASCERCGGSGEIAMDDDTAKRCPYCEAVWDLIKRIEPAPPPAPVLPQAATTVNDEWPDDIPF